MLVLPESGINKIIDNLEMLADTQNSHIMYKKNGWKSSLSKYQMDSQNQEMAENLAVREMSVELLRRPVIREDLQLDLPLSTNFFERNQIAK